MSGRALRVLALCRRVRKDALTLELFDDSRGIVKRETGEEWRHCRGGDPHDDEGEETNQRNGDCRHRGDARTAERLDELD